MDASHVCQRDWDKMSAENQGSFLRFLEMDTFHPGMWDGKCSGDLVKVPYDDLPGDLQGNLILAWTEDGFSVLEMRRALSKRF